MSAFSIRDSLGPNLLNRVISLAGLDASGPMLLIVTIQQINYITVFLVQTVCNQIEELKLKSILGENVTRLEKTIIEKIKQIEGLGNKSVDFLYLIAKPYTTGTEKIFRIFVQQIYITIIDQSFKSKYMDIIQRMNNFY